MTLTLDEENYIEQLLYDHIIIYDCTFESNIGFNYGILYATFKN